MLKFHPLTLKVFSVSAVPLSNFVTNVSEIQESAAKLSKLGEDWAKCQNEKQSSALHVDVLSSDMLLHFETRGALKVGTQIEAKFPTF